MDIGKLINIPKDENYILFNTIYHNHIEGVDGVDDALTLIFKNLDTGEKIIRTIDNPKIEINKVKDGVNLENYNYVDIDIDDTETVEVSYKNLVYELAKLTNQVDYFWNCIKEKRFKDLNRIKLDNRLFISTDNIEDFYRIKIVEYLGMKELKGTTKGFLDIETDLRKGYIDFKSGTGTAPINAVTFVDGKNLVSYTLVLRDKDNPLVEDAEKRKKEMIAKAKEMNKEFVDLEYKIAYFDSELEIITTLFKIINYLKLDFVVIWNMSFDMPYIIDRILSNGADPTEIICNSDFRYKTYNYYMDKNNYEIKKKTDHFKVSSYTIFMCQMINYASVRKSSSQFDSYKLDYIGGLEVGATKLDYSDVCNHIKDFPYVDFFKFILYNIRDVIVQYAIEKKVMDLDTILYRSYESSTRFDKIFKEITFLTNVAIKEFKIQGIILGTNVNAINYNNKNQDNKNNDENALIEEDEKGKKKFKGAIVGNPLLILATGLIIIGRRKSSSLFRFVVDYDYTSLYPTILELFNIYKKALLGQVRLVSTALNKLEEIFAKGDPNYNRGAKFTEDIEIKEPILLGERWFGLPNVSEICNLIDNSLSDKDKYRYIKVINEKDMEEQEEIKIIRVKKV